MRSNARLRRFAAIISLIVVLLLLAAIVRPAVTNAYVRRSGDEGGNPSALLRVEVAPIDLLEERQPDREEVAALLRTQEQLITSPNVLMAASVNPRVASMRFVREADDAEVAIRDHLDVRVLDGSTLIEISSRGLEPTEGAIVVNAVVQAFLAANAEWAEARTRQEIKLLESYLADIQAKAESLAQSIDSSGRLTLTPNGVRVDRVILEDELRDCLRQLRRVRLGRAALQARLDDSKSNADAEDQAGGDDVRVALAASDHQEAMLAEERDRLAAALAEEDIDGMRRRFDQAKIDQVIEMRRQVQDRLETLRFEASSGDSITVIAEARP